MTIWKVAAKTADDGRVVIAYVLVGVPGERRWIYEVVHTETGEQRHVLGADGFDVGHLLREDQLRAHPGSPPPPME